MIDKMDDHFSRYSEVLSDKGRLVKVKRQMEESRESSHTRMTLAGHACDFPPYYVEQAGKRASQYRQYSYVEQGPIEYYRPSTEQDELSIQSAQCPLHSPLTPPHTPQQIQHSRSQHQQHCTVQHCTGCCESPRRDRLPVTTPLYVRTSPTPWPSQPLRRQEVGEPDFRVRFIGDVRRYPDEMSDSRETIKPIPLQDPPKPKVKRQLSEETDELRPVVASYDVRSGPLPSPRPSYSTPRTPRTPQPDNANKSFVFPEPSCLSPKKLKVDNVFFPPSFQNEPLECRSPKRVKGEDGLARPPQSPLVKDRVSAMFNTPNTNTAVITDASSTLIRGEEQFQDQYNTFEPRLSSDENLIFQYPPTNPEHYGPTNREVYREQIPPYTDHPDRYAQTERIVYGYQESPYKRLVQDIRHSPQKDLQDSQKYCQCCDQPRMGYPSPVVKQHKPQPCRSQSNIEYSPNKKELQELEKEKYLRSMSKPEGHRDMHSLSRQKFLRRNGVLLPDPTYTGVNQYQLLPYVELDTRQGPASVCRQLFESREADTRMEAESCGHSPSEIPVRYQRSLYKSSAAYDTYLVRPMTSHFEPEEEYMRLQQRRQSFSTSGELLRPKSPVKGKPSPGRPKQGVSVRLQCVDVAKDNQELSSKLQSKTPTVQSCTCESVQAEILNIAKIAYAKAKRDNTSIEEFERSQKELRDTNSMIREALNIAAKLKEMCGHHRKINDVYSGSVVMDIQCSTLSSLENLREMYTSGELKRTLYSIFVTERLKRKFGIKHVLLSVTIDEEDFNRCRENLVSPLMTGHQKERKPIPKLSPLKRETKSVEDLENIPSCPQSPVFVVHMRSVSTPVLMTSSPLSSPSFNSKSPSTPTKRERIFSFSTVDSKRGRRRSSRERKYSLTSPCFGQSTTNEDPPCSPSRINFTISENEHPSGSREPRSGLRKSLEDITFDMANVNFKR